MTESFRVDDALAWTGGSLAGGPPDARFSSVAIDSRRVQPGGLFVAIVGPNNDAHRFIESVVSSGASGVVVRRDRAAGLPSSGSAVIAVDDTTRALGRLAAGHRQRFAGPLVGITGSSGKTTTKEMCAAILRQKAPCLMTEGNLNNEFGLPLTLLRREPEHELAVIELGMNHRGEIAHLARLARPTVGLITNVGTAHIEFLGSREEIAAEKGDLFAALEPDGIAVVNRDDPRVCEQAKRVPGRCIGYGTEPDADIGAASVRFLDEGRFAFRLATPWGDSELRVTGLGETTVINALAAAAAALAAGATLEHVTLGLEQYGPIRGRMAPVALGRGITLVDDSYNANPQSMLEALSSLARIARGGRGIAVLGDMGELGDTRESAHRETGAAAAALGIDRLIVLGASGECVVEGAVAAGMDRERAVAARDQEEAASRVYTELVPGDWVLVKGSRAMQMERVVEALVAKEADR